MEGGGGEGGGEEGEEGEGGGEVHFEVVGLDWKVELRIEKLVDVVVSDSGVEVRDSRRLKYSRWKMESHSVSLYLILRVSSEYWYARREERRRRGYYQLERDEPPLLRVQARRIAFKLVSTSSPKRYLLVGSYFGATPTLQYRRSIKVETRIEPHHGRQGQLGRSVVVGATALLILTRLQLF